MVTDELPEKAQLMFNEWLTEQDGLQIVPEQQLPTSEPQNDVMMD